MHMNSFSICWGNWHAGPTDDSITGVYVPGPTQGNALYSADSLACVQTLPSAISAVYHGTCPCIFFFSLKGSSQGEEVGE